MLGGGAASLGAIHPNLYKFAVVSILRVSKHFPELIHVVFVVIAI